MTQDDPKTLVSTDWLATHLKDPDLRILDASWYMPGPAAIRAPNTRPRIFPAPASSTSTT